MNEPSRDFIARTRNPETLVVRRRESAVEIAYRIRNGIAGLPAVMLEGNKS